MRRCSSKSTIVDEAPKRWRRVRTAWTAASESIKADLKNMRIVDRSIWRDGYSDNHPGRFTRRRVGRQWGKAAWRCLRLISMPADERCDLDPNLLFKKGIRISATHRGSHGETGGCGSRQGWQPRVCRRPGGRTRKTNDLCQGRCENIPVDQPDGSFFQAS